MAYTRLTDKERDLVRQECLERVELELGLEPCVGDAPSSFPTSN